MPSHGALTLFFRWRKKSVQKKASGTATPEAARPAARRGLRPAVAPSGLSSSSVRFAHPPGKSPLLPILAAGLAMSRAAWVASLRLLSCALGARLFPPSKWAGLFPSAAYRRSAPPQLAWGIRTLCGLGSFNAVGKFCGVDKRTGFLFTGDGGHTPPLQVGMLRCGLEIFAAQKASVSLISRWP